MLPKHPGKCSRLHGHSWVLHVYVKGSINPDTGFVQDFADISKIVNPLIDRLDHRHLGTWGHILTDVEDLEDRHAHDNWYVPDMMLSMYPTSENLLWWIAGELTKAPWTFSDTWSKLTLEETCTSSATLTREEYDAQGLRKDAGQVQETRNIQSSSEEEGR